MAYVIGWLVQRCLAKFNQLVSDPTLLTVNIEKLTQHCRSVGVIRVATEGEDGARTVEDPAVQEIDARRKRGYQIHDVQECGTGCGWGGVAGGGYPCTGVAGQPPIVSMPVELGGIRSTASLW